MSYVSAEKNVGCTSISASVYQADLQIGVDVTARDWFLLMCGLAAVVGLLDSLSVLESEEPTWIAVGLLLLVGAVVPGIAWARQGRRRS